MKQTVVLAILDGWGIGEDNESNAIYMAKPKVIDYLEKNFPAGALKSSGLAVGLPWAEEGNSEVGHLTLGAGRVLYQNCLKITKSIEKGEFFKKPQFKQAFKHARTNNSSVHLVGLLTEGNVHSSFNHIAALVEMAKREKITNLYLHFYTDGRDSPPYSALKLLKKVEQEIIQKHGLGTVATLSGRHYGMDRDKHWDRTKKAYDVLTGEGALQPREVVIQAAYDRNLNDEFVMPAVIAGPHPIKENDAVIFFNFREDRMRQLSEAFLNPSFNAFPVKQFTNLFVVTMIQYNKEVPAHVVFPPEKVPNTLGEILSRKGKIQLRVAETEKYAHITYFFNGLREQPFANEFRILIPSAKVVSHDKYPQMMAEAITNRVIVSLREGSSDFILLNYANPDMVAHTANYHATIEAIKTVDKEVGKLVKEVLNSEHILIVTSDHGNAEVIFDMTTGQPQTKHDPNPVPCYLVGNKFKKSETTGGEKLPTVGLLSDIAPTVLELMKVPQPPEMTGTSLLSIL